MLQRLTTIIPPVYLIGFMLVMAVAHGVLPITKMVPEAWRGWGNLGALMAFGWVIYCAFCFKRAKTPLRPFVPVETLITTGPFAISRNPVYLGMFGVLIGWAVALGSLSPWFFVLAFILFIHFGWVLPEEAQLEREMGEAYRSYKKKVRRWL